MQNTKRYSFAEANFSTQGKAVTDSIPPKKDSYYLIYNKATGAQ